ncbi:MAG: hypothetical protein ACRDPE_01885 [Solirubrobacterales bacterium]
MAQSRKKGKAKSGTGTKPKAAAKAKKPKRPKSGKAKRAAKSKAATKPKEGAPKAPSEAATGTAADGAKDLPADEVSTAPDAPLGAGVNAALAGKAALAGTRAAGRAVGLVASKVKGPIVVGGGLAAGAVGGLALVRRRNGSSSQGPLDVERVIDAARRAGAFGEELGRMASLLEQANTGSKRKRK